jgi:peroxiredoxin (alkyl hydroperoxide reductase subunit C)
MVARHGVLCPVDWEPSTNTVDTINTISNTLTESYEDRLANLQKEFGMGVTEYQNKHSANDKRNSETSGASSSAAEGDSSQSGPPPAPLEEVVCARPYFQSSSNDKETSQTDTSTPTPESANQSLDSSSKPESSPPSSPSQVQESKPSAEATSTPHDERGTHTPMDMA